MFPLNRIKQKSNRNSLIGAYLANFYRKFRGFPIFCFFQFFLFFFVFFGLFQNSLFRLFHFYTETESFDVSIEPKQTKTHPNSLKESIFGYFSKNLGLLRFVTKQFFCFGCFDIGSKHRNKMKFFYFWFHETNRNKRETDLVSVCFGSNQNLFLFVSRTP